MRNKTFEKLSLFFIILLFVVFSSIKFVNFKASTDLVNNEEEIDSIEEENENIDLLWAHESVHLNEISNITRGSEEILIGIIDSGIDGNHPDLTNMIDTSLCRDFTSGIGVVDTNPTDSYGHGTMVAGIIAASCNNSYNFHGVNQHVKLVSLKCSNSANAPIERICDALSYASSHNINIVNISAGIGRHDLGDNYNMFKNAINNFPGLVICSAGNSGGYLDDDDSDGNYPASYDCDNIIAVGGIDNNDAKVSSSNFGPSTVDIFAPGEDVFTCYPTWMCENHTCINDEVNHSIVHKYDGYHTGTGTSIAAPYVTGTVGLLLSINPNLTMLQIKQIILEQSDEIDIIGFFQDEDDNFEREHTLSVNKLNVYKAVKYVLSNLNTSIINLSNYSSPIDFDFATSNSTTYFNDLNGFYKLSVNYEKYYEFYFQSNQAIDVKILDEDLNETDYNDFISSPLRTHFITNLKVGYYYLLVRYTDYTCRGNINISLRSRNTAYLSLGDNNILLNSYNNVNTYYFNNSTGSDLYKFSFNISPNIVLQDDALKIYSDSNRTVLLPRFDEDGALAATTENERELYVYLPKNGPFYVDIDCGNNNYNYSELSIEITKVESNELDYNNSLINTRFDEIFPEINNNIYFERVSITHRSKIQIDVQTFGSVVQDIPVYTYVRKFNDVDDQYYLESVLDSIPVNSITIFDSNPVFSLVLDKGIYYVGYKNNINNIGIQIAFRRYVQMTQNQDTTLVSDPALNQGFTLGSEVNLLGGQLQGNTITEGFTRCIYLMVENRFLEPMSRLSYDWYSSNNNVAIVTNYGTVLGLSVENNENVRIFAVLKDDPSIVYYTDFIILNDIRPSDIVVRTTVTYSRGSGIYQLPIESNNSPYPYIQYYDWRIYVDDEYDITVEIDNWGHITASGNGSTRIVGQYILNPKVYVVFYVNIVD